MRQNAARLAIDDELAAANAMPGAAVQAAAADATAGDAIVAIVADAIAAAIWAFSKVDAAHRSLAPSSLAALGATSIGIFAFPDHCPSFHSRVLVWHLPHGIRSPPGEQVAGAVTR